MRTSKKTIKFTPAFVLATSIVALNNRQKPLTSRHSSMNIRCVRFCAISFLWYVRYSCMRRIAMQVEVCMTTHMPAHVRVNLFSASYWTARYWTQTVAHAHSVAASAINHRMFSCNEKTVAVSTKTQRNSIRYLID